MKSHIKSAVKGLWINKWSTLMAIMSIGICFFIIVGVFLSLYNIEIFTKKLSSKATIVVYIKDGASQSEISLLMEEIKKMGVFSSLQYISKEDALKEIENLIEPQLIELIGFNPLGDTLEAFIKEESLGDAQEIAKKIKSFAVVEDVYYPAKIVSGLRLIRITVWNFTVAVFCFLSFAILFIIYVTVKNFYWRKTEEIEILKLLGATPSYIRLPFLIEGSILGLGGAFFAGVLTFIVHFILHSKSFSEFLPAITQISVPVETFYILPVFGILLGMLSSFFALGKIKYQ